MTGPNAQTIQVLHNGATRQYRCGFGYGRLAYANRPDKQKAKHAGTGGTTKREEALLRSLQEVEGLTVLPLVVPASFLGYYTITATMTGFDPNVDADIQWMRYETAIFKTITDAFGMPHADIKRGMPYPVNHAETDS